MIVPTDWSVEIASSFFDRMGEDMVGIHRGMVTCVVGGGFVRMRWEKELGRVPDIEGCIAQGRMKRVERGSLSPG